MIFNLKLESLIIVISLIPFLKSQNSTEIIPYNQEYHWKASSWSSCSRSCGRGQSSRDLSCVSKRNPNINVDKKFCLAISPYVPENMRLCGILDCLPRFVPGKWTPCQGRKPCEKGHRMRLLYCRQLLSDGNEIEVSKSFCYRYMKSSPPRNWESCIYYGDLKKNKCKTNRKSETKLIELVRKNTIFYQMRTMKRVKIQIGQTSHLLPRSRVYIICPVRNYFSSNLKWIFRGKTYSYYGRRKFNTEFDGKVDRKGRMKIRNLSKQLHEGVWTCLAGTKTASVSIKIRDPSSGYRDWLKRRQLIELIPPIKAMNKRSVYYDWFKSDWSTCSVTCISKANEIRGYQNRMVRCEELQSRFYEEVSDYKCKNNKPQTIRQCLVTSQCPKWYFEPITNPKFTTYKCTDDCVNVGQAVRNISLFCAYQGVRVKNDLCTNSQQPKLLCENNNCQLQWRVTQWTQCSQSCGKSGYQARSIFCVWSHSGNSAGTLCHENNLPKPDLFRTCHTPPCQLGCIDLVDNCYKKLKYCYDTFYRYICCQTCQILIRAYFKQIH